MKRTRTAQFVVGFGLAVALLGGVVWSDWRQVNRARQAHARVRQEQLVLRHLGRLQLSVLDVAVGARSFVITGDPAFLKPFEAGLKTVEVEVRELRRSILASQYESDLAALESLVAERTAMFSALVQLRRQSGFEAAQRQTATGTGEAVLDRIRVLVARLSSEAQTRMDGWEAESARGVSAAAVLSAVGIGLGALILIGTFGLVLREHQQRRRAQAQIDRFFALSYDLLAIAGTDGYFKRVNPAFTRVLGYTAETLLARPFLDFVHPDDRPATLAEVAKLSRGVRTIQFENRY